MKWTYSVTEGVMFKEMWNCRKSLTHFDQKIFNNQIFIQLKTFSDFNDLQTLNIVVFSLYNTKSHRGLINSSVTSFQQHLSYEIFRGVIYCRWGWGLIIMIHFLHEVKQNCSTGWCRYIHVHMSTCIFEKWSGWDIVTNWKTNWLKKIWV